MGALAHQTITNLFVQAHEGCMVRILANESCPEFQEGSHLGNKTDPYIRPVQVDLRGKVGRVWGTYFHPSARAQFGEAVAPHSISVRVEDAMFILPSTAEYVELVEPQPFVD